MVLAARHGGPAGGVVGARQAGSAHRLPLRGLAGGLPFLAAVYGATVGRLRYRVITIEVPSTDLPPHLDGLRMVHPSDIHIAAFMPRALFLCVPRIVDTHAPLPQHITEGAITTEQTSSVPLQSFSVFSAVHI